VPDGWGAVVVEAGEDDGESDVPLVLIVRYPLDYPKQVSCFFLWNLTNVNVMLFGRHKRMPHVHWAIT
jgi:hypothetical protein